MPFFFSNTNILVRRTMHGQNFCQLCFPAYWLISIVQTENHTSYDTRTVDSGSSALVVVSEFVYPTCQVLTFCTIPQFEHLGGGKQEKDRKECELLLDLLAGVAQLRLSLAEGKSDSYSFVLRPRIALKH